MLYPLIKPFVRFSLSQYFSEIEVRGAPLVEDGPLLVVSNHPNHFLDPVVVASTYNRELSFLAKSIVFNRASTPLLTSLNALPIYRRMDNPELMYKNKECLQAATQRLEEGGAILIFPEGISENQRFIMKLKSGASRLALSTQKKLSEKPMRIQPLGLTYSGFHRFRSVVTIDVGEPIEVQQFYTGEAEDKASINALTEHISERLHELTVVMTEREDVKLIGQIARVYSSLNGPSGYKERLSLVKKNLEGREEELRADVARIRPVLEEYLSLLDSFELRDGTQLERKVNIPLLLTAPFVLIGYLIQFFPNQLLRRFLEKRPVDRKTGSLKFGLGFLLYWFWYLFLGVLFGILTSNIVAGMFFVALGAFSVASFHRSFDKLRIALTDLFFPKDRLLSQLREKQKYLLGEFEALRAF